MFIFCDNGQNKEYLFHVEYLLNDYALPELPMLHLELLSQV